MSLFNRKKRYEAVFSAHNPNDASNLEKELVSLIALDLAIGKSAKEKKIKEFKPGMVNLPDDYYGIDTLSDEENNLFVEQAKHLVSKVSKGISVNAGYYSINVRKKDYHISSDISSKYEIKVVANKTNNISEREAEAHSMTLARQLGPYSEVKIIKNTLADYWNIIK
jgi:hypothetical protein